MSVWVVYCFSDEESFWGIHSVLEFRPTDKELELLKIAGCFDSVIVECFITVKVKNEL